MKLSRSCIVGLVALIVAMATGAAQANEVDDAYRDFRDGHYAATFNRLFRYRLETEGTLRVDFMLAVSSCRLRGADQKALGGYLLSRLDGWYGPLTAANRRDVRAQAGICPPTQMSFDDAVASISGKSDLTTKQLASAKSRSGAADGLPGAPAAVEFQPLLAGRAFVGNDIRSVTTATPELCTTVCAEQPACRAVTWIRSQQLCWLKRSESPMRSSSDMVSARRRSP